MGQAVLHVVKVEPELYPGEVIGFDINIEVIAKAVFIQVQDHAFLLAKRIIQLLVNGKEVS
jgi:hypothetical protein